MKRGRQTRENEENEDTKRERHDHNERENEESDGEDRLSDFPDSIVLHILSFLTAKEAVQTCILSKRWKNLWKHIPTLTLTSNDFKNLKDFTKFVTRILSLRDSGSALKALNFQRRGSVEPNLLKRIVRFALSHNVDRLGLYCRMEQIQPSLFSSHTLKKLSLLCRKKPSRFYPINNTVVVFPSNLNFPALTTLNLWFLVFRAGEDGRADPFSGFNRLNSLIIDDCMVMDGKTLCISNATLVDLCLNPSNVPGEDYPKIDLYAPNLRTFAFHGTPFRNLCGTNLSSLKHLNADSYAGDDNPLILLNWLIELAHIRSLTVSLSTLHVLFSGPHKLKVKLPSLCNLKLLKVKAKPDSRVPDEMVDLLLQNAPLAELCIEKKWRDLFNLFGCLLLTRVFCY